MRDRHEVADSESSLSAAPSLPPAQADRLDSLERENAHLRAIVQNVMCVYGHRNAEGYCELGYPGCACMDDLMALTAWLPEGPCDPVIVLQNRNSIVERRLTETRELVRLAVRYLQSTADGFERERVPSKAAAARAMADMLDCSL